MNANDAKIWNELKCMLLSKDDTNFDAIIEILQKYKDSTLSKTENKDLTSFESVMSEDATHNRTFTRDAIKALIRRKEPLAIRNGCKCQDLEKFADSLMKGSLSKIEANWRVIPVNQDNVVDENECIHIPATFAEFFQFVHSSSDANSNIFQKFLSEHSPCAFYADYMHFPDIFGNVDKNGEAFAAFSGLSQNYQDNLTLWVSSKGSYTPTHFDSYGVNVIYQVAGSKKWKLWPPNSNQSKPSIVSKRLPYEESSVYARHDLPIPLPEIEVDLHEGDTLFVPKHWWHFVETTSDFAISVNMWVEQPSDSVDQVEESIVRFIFGAMADAAINCNITTPDMLKAHGWINPSEVDSFSEKIDHASSLAMLERSVGSMIEEDEESNEGIEDICEEYQSTTHTGDSNEILKIITDEVLKSDTINRCLKRLYPSTRLLRKRSKSDIKLNSKISKSSN